MTSTTKEILENHQIRKTRKQKTAFINWLRPILERDGWTVREEKGSFGVRNIVIGDPDKAKIIYTAHYDTCVRLPFPNLITPKSIPLYILYQIVMTAVILLSAFAFAFICGILAELIRAGLLKAGLLLGWYGVLLLFLFGPANRHTANDNTSGVTAVIDLALSLPREQREKCAFVLFDLEEAGLIGSSNYARKHKDIQKKSLLVNMDCVSDGETMIFCFRKDSRKETERFQHAFPQDHRIRPEFLTRGYVYPSDQSRFNRGVGVSAMRSTRGGLLYMNRIHTKRDTVYRAENIEWLVEGCLRLAAQMEESHESA